MQVLPQVSLIQCMCCCEEKPRSSVTVCRKNHALCAACAERLGRVDCLFCNPYSPQKPEGPAISWTEKVKILRDVCAGLLLVCIRFVTCFMALTYLGKCFVYLYLICNPDEDLDWFGWDRLDMCLGEALIGLFVGMMLVGMCCGPAR